MECLLKLEAGIKGTMQGGRLEEKICWSTGDRSRKEGEATVASLLPSCGWDWKIGLGGRGRRGRGSDLQLAYMLESRTWLESGLVVISGYKYSSVTILNLVSFSVLRYGSFVKVYRQLWIDLSSWEEIIWVIFSTKFVASVHPTTTTTDWKFDSLRYKC